MDIDALQDFQLVAAHGGFGKASRASGRSKATLSRRLADFEVALGMRLIERGGDYELQRQAARDAGAALEPGTRTRGDAGAEQGFTQPEAWVAAVDLTVRTLRESL